MIGTVITAVIAFSGASEFGWELRCPCPMDLLLQDRERDITPQLTWPVPGSPVTMTQRKRPWVSLSLLPDLVGYDTETLRSPSFSISNSKSSFKAQLLRRVGLREEKAGGFGMTLRFASAPNWAFQFKGMKRVTVAYVTKF